MMTNGIYIDSRASYASSKLGAALRSMALPAERKTVIVCIGSDKVTGDCLGPLTGKFLKESSACTSLFGTLEQPVHAINLDATMRQINTLYQNPFIIAVDACLGRWTHVGFINVMRGAIRPGAGTGKILPGIGDIGISGIVNIPGGRAQLSLQSTRLHLVMRMAEVIASGLADGIKTG